MIIHNIKDVTVAACEGSQAVEVHEQGLPGVVDEKGLPVMECMKKMEQHVVDMDILDTEMVGNDKMDKVDKDMVSMTDKDMVGV